ncbi:hypothetical protein GGX14DRAFT_624380 [Mycena pura]|uniref:Aminoglycoside phosphotransferase domain-containing protein n=1 Tax=Mycena pura TaxID=153505 RepID=A0AAD6YB80_9AGAR|nr:hypothetical protein GGX14DRAFT_624380 [Mycena pura]
MSLNDAYPQTAAINAAAQGPLHSFLAPAHATQNTYNLPPPTTKAFIFDPQAITQSVKQMLASHEAHSEAKIDNAVQLLLSEMSAARQESREHVGQIAEVLQKSHAINLARLKRLENIMGMGSDMENSDEKTLLSRFDLLSFAVEELLERLKDPEANFPDSLPLRRDAATSPIKRVNVDGVISPRTPAPKPQSSIAMGTPSYTDAYSNNDPSSSTLVADDTVPFSDQKSSQVLSVPVDGAPCIETAAVPKPTFRASLVPVDWANQDPADMRPVSVSPRPNQLSDDTVVSLTLGVGSPITTSRRSQSVHPVSSAFSVSPLQPPRETTPHFVALADGKSVSSASEDIDRQTFVEEVESDARSPSADTVREELSVQDLMSAMQSSPSPSLPNDAVPSSISPSPFLQSRRRSISPPSLVLSFQPRASTGAAPRSPLPQRTAIFPSEDDLFGGALSPVPPSTPSRSPSPGLLHEAPLSRHNGDTMETPVSSTTRPKATLRPLSSVNKKRKSNPQEPEAGSSSERPTKRDRKEAGPSVKKKIKKEKSDAVIWPPMTPASQINPEFDGNFIGCDREEECGSWFHYSCLGIVPGDPRLTGKFLCPFCVAGRPPAMTSSESSDQLQCAHPACPTTDVFFEPAGVFGRYTILHSTLGRVTYWLVFWKGYAWKDATWESSLPEKLIDEFRKQALAEGHDVDDDSIPSAKVPRNSLSRGPHTSTFTGARHCPLHNAIEVTLVLPLACHQMPHPVVLTSSGYESDEYPELHPNLDALSEAVASVLHQPVVEQWKKLTRGTYHEIYVSTLKDGSPLIARLSRREEDPHQMLSELETMRHVQTHTRIPVPAVHLYDTARANAVGMQYVVMERMPGVHLYRLWDDLSLEHQKSVLEDIADILAQLSTLRFERIGMLALDGVGVLRSLPAISIADASMKYESHFNAGPFSSAREYLVASVEQLRLHPDAPSDLLPLLNEVKSIVSNYCERHSDAIFLRPPFRLMHGDFDAQNLLFEESKNGAAPRLSAVIDWENSLIGPLYHLFEYPIFIQDVDWSKELYPRNAILRPHFVRALARAAGRETMGWFPDQKSATLNNLYSTFMMGVQHGCWEGVRSSVEMYLREELDGSGKPYNGRIDWTPDPSIDDSLQSKNGLEHA